MTEQGGAYFCEYDGKTSQTMRRRYVLSAKVMDFTGESWVSIFNDQVRLGLWSAGSMKTAEGAGVSEAGHRWPVRRYQE